MKVPEKYRVKTGRFGTNEDAGNNGIFAIKKGKLKMQVIASDGAGWDHVSVTIANRQRTPTWEEMCFIKDLFFDKNEWVSQFHPAECDYVNNNKYCLHLWKSHIMFPTPHKILV